MTKTKILLFDIETAPNVSYTWGKWQQDVIKFQKEWYMLSFAYKWYGDDKVHAFGLPDFKLYKKDKYNDKELVKKLHELFNEADIIIAHNGDEFDIKKSNARFIYHGLTPPSPFKTIDTKKVAKRYFNFNSNSLNDLGGYLQVGNKVPTGGFDLWLGCMAGNKKSWATMIEYNKQDVSLLEEIYTVFRPWMHNHPNVNILDEVTNCCPACGSNKLVKEGFGFNANTKYQRYSCKKCGKWSKSNPISVGLEIKNVC